MQKDVINVTCPRCKARPGEQCGGKAQPDSAGNRVHIPRVDRYIKVSNLATEAWDHLQTDASSEYHREQFSKKMDKVRALI
ncbi:hypothetical protein PBI_GRETELLYN_89 [Gordonia phage GretelLyn]|nr:hypothetical protein PBI_GRETELLYN_89 [Gordonia phage GretelLyn]